VRTNAYFQGWMNAMLGLEVVKRTLAANQELNAVNMMRAARSIQNYDTGGLVGAPISMTRNSFPVGRVYQYNAAEKRLIGASDWITVGAAS
jgi:branched-chain amino acid transport system substrate-binding protein